MYLLWRPRTKITQERKEERKCLRSREDGRKEIRHLCSTWRWKSLGEKRESLIKTNTKGNEIWRRKEEREWLLRNHLLSQLDVLYSHLSMFIFSFILLAYLLSSLCPFSRHTALLHREEGLFFHILHTWEALKSLFLSALCVSFLPFLLFSLISLFLLTQQWLREKFRSRREESTTTRHFPVSPLSLLTCLDSSLSVIIPTSTYPRREKSLPAPRAFFLSSLLPDAIHVPLASLYHPVLSLTLLLTDIFWRFLAKCKLKESKLSS